MENPIVILNRKRNALVGLGTAWVMLYHARLLTLPVGDFIRQIGYGGVDICLFLSGFGISVSLNKNGNWKQFYLRRMKRIYPQYLLVTGAYSLFMYLYQGFSIGDILLTMTALFYFVSPKMTYNWYIPALLFLYAVSPVFSWIIEKWKKNSLVLILSVFVLSAFLGLLQHLAGITRFLIFTTRIPLYFLGMMMGSRFFHNTSCEVRRSGVFVSAMLALSSIAVLYVLHSRQAVYLMAEFGLYWYPFFFFIPGLCVACGRLLCLAEKTRVGSVIHSALDWLGKNSLLIYLVSATFTISAPYVIPDEFVQRNVLLYNLTQVAAVFVLCWCYNRICAFFKKRKQS